MSRKNDEQEFFSVLERVMATYVHHPDTIVKEETVQTPLWKSRITTFILLAYAEWDLKTTGLIAQAGDHLHLSPEAYQSVYKRIRQTFVDFGEAVQKEILSGGTNIWYPSFVRNGSLEDCFLLLQKGTEDAISEISLSVVIIVLTAFVPVGRLQPLGYEGMHTTSALIDKINILIDKYTNASFVQH